MDEDKFECDECGTEFHLYRYGDGQCPECGRDYVYDDCRMPVLTAEDWDAIRDRKKA